MRHAHVCVRVCGCVHVEAQMWAVTVGMRLRGCAHVIGSRSESGNGWTSGATGAPPNPLYLDWMSTALCTTVPAGSTDATAAVARGGANTSSSGNRSTHTRVSSLWYELGTTSSFGFPSARMARSVSSLTAMQE